MNIDFQEAIMSGSKEVLEEYIRINGKQPKPYCPFVFIKKESEEEENGTTMGKHGESDKRN